ncbi:MAG: glucokinase, partial [Succinivibrionaceae bacterium]|nr:glucokinase [Succinivibrionaceae bacterium]
LYEAIVFADKRTPERLTPAEVAIRAKQNSDTDCFRALNLFCIILGRFGGDLALTAGAFGGVYIAGGIIPKNLDFFLKSGFRTAFEDKGRFKEYLSKIPVYVIVNDQPGLVGSAAVIRQKLGAKA